MKGQQFGLTDSDPQWENQGAYDQQTPYSTGAESHDATSSLGWDDTAVGLMARYSAIRDAESNGAEKLSPEQANSKYPGMPTPFREPVNPVVAQMLADREQEKQDLARKIQNGPQDMWQKTKNFGTGLITHAMDPLEFGAGSVIGWGVGAAAVKTAWGARAASAAAGGSFGARMALNTVEAASGNLVQNSVQELANAGVSDMEGVKYDPVEGMKSVALGTLMGTAMGVGIKEGSWRMTRFLRGTSPEADLAVLRAARGQYEAGLKPDVTPLLTALAKETDVKPGDFPGKFDYNYEPIQSEASLKGKTFYVPADGVDKFNPDNARMVGDEHGIGVQMTDHPGVANAAAARAMADAPGHVFHVDGENIRPFNLESSIPDDLKPAFLNAMGSAVGDASEQIEKASGKDIMSAIMNAVDEGDLDPKAVTDLQAALKEKGYNAFVQNGSSVAGVEHSPHNLVTVFDDSMGSHKYEYSPMDVASPTKGKVLYHGTKADLNGLSSADVYGHSSVKNLFGEGLYLTDNPHVAASYAETKGKGPSGKVLAGKLNDVKLIDLEKAPPPEVHKIISNVIAQYTEDKVSAKASGSVLFQHMREAMADAGITESEAMDVYAGINAELSDAGFDGYRHTGGSRTRLGQELGPHNVVILFEDKGMLNGEMVGRKLENKITDHPFNQADLKPAIDPVGFSQADPEVRNQPTETQIRDVIESRNDPNKLLSVDEQTLRDGEALVQQADREGIETPEEIEDQDFYDQFQAMEDQGLIDPAIAAEVEKIKGLDAEFAKQDTLMKAVIGCVYG